MSILRRGLVALIRPAYRLFLRLSPRPDAWEELSYGLRFDQYGEGIQYDFGEYLRGPSTVTVTSVGEIQDWLDACAFRTDTDHFGREHWQHPSEFEERRVGDCDDFAVWAWRKLIELGKDARLIVGRTMPISEPKIRHAWVVFRDGDQDFLFETVGSREEMIRPLEEVRHEYRPELGVDRTGKCFSYGGFLLTIREAEGVDPAPYLRRTG